MRRRSKVVFFLCLGLCGALYVLCRREAANVHQLLNGGHSLAAGPSLPDAEPRPVPPATAAVSSLPNAATSNLSKATRQPIPRSTQSPPAVGDQIGPSALRQIAALAKAKAARTPIQQRIDSQLLYADLMRRGLPVAEGVPAQRVNLDQDSQGRVLVDIKADVSAELLGRIEALGGNVINNFPEYQAIRAAVPLASMESVAAQPGVRFVRPAVRSSHSAIDSQGDVTHQAAVARSTFGVNGSGVKVGVLSDSVDSLNTSQIAGLVTVVPGQGGTPGTGEGTAMLEIVHDLAPGAQLYFATAKGGDANFANNIRQLRTNGCAIIVDDEQYFDESPFQDAVIAQAVNDVTSAGVLYFASANNSGAQGLGNLGDLGGRFCRRRRGDRDSCRGRPAAQLRQFDPKCCGERCRFASGAQFVLVRSARRLRERL